MVSRLPFEEPALEPLALAVMELARSKLQVPVPKEGRQLGSPPVVMVSAIAVLESRRDFRPLLLPDEE
jgi:hypothetical protein